MIEEEEEEEEEEDFGAVISVVVGSLVINKKGRHKPINMISGCPSLYEMQELHFAELYNSLGDYF